MTKKAKTGKRMAKRKTSYAPGASEGDHVRDVAYRARKEQRRG
jgi:hypothetical protein